MCATTGYCQNSAIFGRRPVEKEECLESACPQPLGLTNQSCNKTFIEDRDGEISCQADSDCPQDRVWWCQEWAGDTGRPCQGTEGATHSSCQAGRCVFTSARDRWVLCLDDLVTKVMDGENQVSVCVKITSGYLIMLLERDIAGIQLSVFRGLSDH